MKKGVLAISAACMIAVLASDHEYVKAAPAETIRSRGSFVFRDDSKVALNSADIAYLQNELNGLYGELPNHGGNDGNPLTEEE